MSRLFFSFPCNFLAVLQFTVFRRFVAICLVWSLSQDFSCVFLISAKNTRTFNKSSSCARRKFRVLNFKFEKWCLIWFLWGSQLTGNVLFLKKVFKFSINLQKFKNLKIKKYWKSIKANWIKIYCCLFEKALTQFHNLTCNTSNTKTCFYSAHTVTFFL